MDTLEGLQKVISRKLYLILTRTKFTLFALFFDLSWLTLVYLYGIQVSIVTKDSISILSRAKLNEFVIVEFRIAREVVGRNIEFAWAVVQIDKIIHPTRGPLFRLVELFIHLLSWFRSRLFDNLYLSDSRWLFFLVVCASLPRLLIGAVLSNLLIDPIMQVHVLLSLWVLTFSHWWHLYLVLGPLLSGTLFASFLLRSDLFLSLPDIFKVLDLLKSKLLSQLP